MSPLSWVQETNSVYFRYLDSLAKSWPCVLSEVAEAESGQRSMGWSPHVLSQTHIMYNFRSFPVRAGNYALITSSARFPILRPSTVQYYSQQHRHAVLPSAAPTFTSSPTASTPSSCLAIISEPKRLPFLRPHFFSTCDMGDHDRPTRFRALFASTLQAYTKTTGISLAEHPLALQLQNCHSVESITALLQDQMRTSSDFGGNDRLEGSIKSAISILSTLSTTAPLDWAIGLVR